MKALRSLFLIALLLSPLLAACSSGEAKKQLQEAAQEAAKDLGTEAAIRSIVGKNAPAGTSELFVQAYKQAPAGIGAPKEGVKYWNSTGTLDSVGFYAQELFGEKGRTILGLSADKQSVFRIYGPWLKAYDEAGGPSVMGPPLNNVKEWNAGCDSKECRGKVQDFGCDDACRLNVPEMKTRSVLMQREETEAVYSIVGERWFEAYVAYLDKGVRGYPLTNRKPMGKKTLGGLRSERTGEIQFFESASGKKYALVSYDESGAGEVRGMAFSLWGTEKERLQQQWSAVLTGEQKKQELPSPPLVRPFLTKNLADLQDLGSNDCFDESLGAAAHGYSAAQLEDAFGQLTKLLILNGIGGVVSTSNTLAAVSVWQQPLSTGQTVLIKGVEFVITVAGEEAPGQEALKFVLQEAGGYLFSKTVLSHILQEEPTSMALEGKFIIDPMGSAFDALEREGESIVVYKAEVPRGTRPLGQISDSDGLPGVKVASYYNSYTHYFTTVIQADCNPNGEYIVVQKVSVTGQARNSTTQVERDTSFIPLCIDTRLRQPRPCNPQER